MSAQATKPRSRPGVAEQQKRILAATRKLLAQHGDREVTVKDLADAAGVSRATFYRCFDNVDAVVDVLYKEFLDHVTQRLERHIKTGTDSKTWLRELVGEVLNDAVEMGPYLLALYREEIRPGSPFFEVQRQRIEAQIDYICDWWESWSGFPVGRPLVRTIVLLPQAAGLSLARSDDPSNERERLEEAVVYMIEATIERYVRDNKR